MRDEGKRKAAQTFAELLKTMPKLTLKVGDQEASIKVEEELTTIWEFYEKLVEPLLILQGFRRKEIDAYFIKGGEEK